MRRHLFVLTALSFFACSQGNGDPDPSKNGAATEPTDTGDNGEPADEDGGSDGTSDEADTGSDGESEAEDTGAPIPDWVDPVVPDGPIPPPEGTDTTPEDGDFDWTGVGTDLIASSLPTEHLPWDDYPRVGTARVLEWIGQRGVRLLRRGLHDLQRSPVQCRDLHL